MKKSFMAFLIVILIGLFTMSSITPVFATSEIDELTVGATFTKANNNDNSDDNDDAGGGGSTDDVLVISLGGLNKSTDAGARILAEYRNIIIGVSGIAALTFIVLFIMNFLKLGQTTGNPQERQSAIMALILTGVGAAGSGGVLLFVTFFYNLFL